MMETERILDAIVARIEAVARPERIVLFGSRARGDARDNSDFDLLVIAAPRRSMRPSRMSPWKRMCWCTRRQR
jgi:predicted nucleotidyltransferase